MQDFASSPTKGERENKQDVIPDAPTTVLPFGTRARAGIYFEICAGVEVGPGSARTLLRSMRSGRDDI
ncbi:hypothetical protein GCM10008941_19220 [Rhizomicrobium palustre]